MSQTPYSTPKHILLAVERGSRHHNEMALLHEEVQKLRGLVEQLIEQDRQRPGGKRQDGRIMFALSRDNQAA